MAKKEKGTKKEGPDTVRQHVRKMLARLRLSKIRSEAGETSNNNG
jgi:hypothetical protein